MVTNSQNLAETPGRRERKREEVRNRLFQAALELFARHGFGETRVEQITEAADVAKGTFFNYFPTKEHILRELALRQRGKVARAREVAEQGQLSIREIVQDLYHRMPHLPIRSTALMRSLLLTFLSQPFVRETMAETMSKGREELARIFTLGQQRGEVRSDMAADDMARVFQQAVLGTVLLWTLKQGSGLDELLQKNFEIFWAGVRSGAGSAKEQS